jgi:signal transduction histidine kinase
VQFISSQVRTPLNTVFTGLKLSIKQFSSEFDTGSHSDRVDNEKWHTLAEIYAACESALTILNELLLYDKLETGLLEVDKTYVAIQDLINDSIEMFAVHLWEKGIDMTVDGVESNAAILSAESRLSTYLSHSYTISHVFSAMDIIHVDKK